MLTGSIAVTGGTGFLARALYRRAILEGWPCTFTAIARKDEGLARIASQFPSVRTTRGDVLDRDHMRAIFAGHDSVIHMAAVKHVDRSEYNVRTTIRVNIDGSRNVLMAARDARVGAVILISTDKAAEPANVYGMTKALCERMYQEANNWVGDTLAYVVRYGNVVASTGSVIPVMIDKLQRGFPVEITNPEMTRFFFPADHAIDCILTALRHPPGIIVAPGMYAISLADLAQAITHYVKGPDAGLSARHIGTRPGEKLHETLVGEAEARHTRFDDDYYLIDPVNAIGTGAGIEPIRSNEVPQIGTETMRRWIADAMEIM